MNDDQAFERAIRDLLEEGSDRTPTARIEAVLLSVRTTPQERDLWIPWRTISMSNPMRFAVALAIVAVAGVASFNLFGASQGPGGIPSPSPTVTQSAPAPTPSPLIIGPIDTSTWTTYVSDRYGFSIDYPADWAAHPADHDWALPADANWLSTAQEAFVGLFGDTLAPDRGLRVSAWSVAVEPGTSIDAWLQAYCAGCPGFADQTSAASMDGHAGAIVQTPDDVQAFFLIDDRMYVLAVWRPEYRQVLEAFLSTMHLLPGGANPAATTPTPS